MIEIIRTNDHELIQNMANQVGYKEWLIEDRIVNFKELLEKGLVCYLFKVDGEIAGYCSYKDIGYKLSYADVAILDKFRGKIGLEISKMAVNRYKQDFDCVMLVTQIDKRNKKSLYFSKWLGFEKSYDDNQYIYLRLILWAGQAK